MSVAKRHGEHARNVVKAQCSRNLPCWILLTLLVVAALLTACQSDGRPVFDKIVPPEKHIPLMDGGPHQGRADTGETLVAYAYTRQPSSDSEVALHVQGQVLDVRISAMMVNIYLLALESDGNVILRRMLYTTGYRSRSTYFRLSWSFDKTVTLPPETAALAIDSQTRVSRGRK